MRNSTPHHPEAVRGSSSQRALVAVLCLPFLASSPLLVGAESKAPAIIATVNASRPTEVKFHIRNTTPAVASVLGWDFGEASSGSRVMSPRHRYKKAGEYTVRFRYRNSAGKERAVVRSINLRASPVVKIIDYGTFSSPTGTRVWLRAAGQQGKRELDARKAKWDFGDGTSARGERVEHVFTTPREYTVKVSIEDEWNTVGTDSVVVRVRAPKATAPKVAAPKPQTPKPTAPKVAAPKPPTPKPAAPTVAAPKPPTPKPAAPE
ncbi:MAG TPA: PKD domain-containing protein, partial [Planctomycetota bacterium]|nr:PKD domain-containing protein [Planctomycetota bacterium]